MWGVFVGEPVHVVVREQQPLREQTGAKQTAQRLRSLRYARQRLGMVPGLVAGGFL